eukprot:m.311760 g.311760  ORF g.311760 m.311760 type:complete len:458 (+) comp141790_c0_seq1:34-1407(+)
MNSVSCGSHHAGVFLVFVSLIGCGFSTLFANLIFVMGYYVKPMEDACPSWSKSIMVVNSALSQVVWPIQAIILANTVQKSNLRVWVLVQAVLVGVGSLISGICAGMCASNSLLTEIFFVVGVQMIISCSGISALVTTFCLLRILPKYAGFCSAYYGTVSTAGAIIFAQIILFEQRFLQDGILTIATVWFVMGLIAAFLPSVSIPCFTKAPNQNNEFQEERSAEYAMSRFEILKTWQFYFLVLARTGMLLPAYGLLARQQDFLETLWLSGETNKNERSSIPIQKIALVVTLTYLIGRLIWLLSDKITVKGSWILSSAIQVVSFGFLPYLIQMSTPYAKYLALTAYCVVNVAFPAAKGTVPALSLILYGPSNTANAWGLILVSSALSGAGPLIMEKLYLSSGGQFTTYLYFGAGMNVVALLASVLLKPVAREGSCNLNVGAQEAAANAAEILGSSSSIF